MVFHGFSRGCYTCRARRIKCDGGRPTCARCAKSKRVCGGYRDEKDLLFHDQTRLTATRANSAPNLADENAKDSSGSASEKLGSENHGSTHPSPTNTSQSQDDEYTIPDSIERIALKFFFDNFIRFPRPSKVARGYLDLLPSAYATAGPDTALHYATIAIAFATLGNNPGWQHLIPQARLKYGEALKRVQEELANPSTAQSDEVLMTILLFALIESVTATEASLPQWGCHCDAAMELVKMRGREALASETSRQLAMAVRNQMTFDCILRSRPLDDFFHDEIHEALLGPGLGWEQTPNQDAHRTHPALYLTNMSLQIPTLRADTVALLDQPNAPSAVPSVLDLIQRCQALDRALAEWPNALPESWKYETLPSNGSISDLSFSPFPGVMHRYCDVWVANVHNSYRIYRLFVQSCIFRCIAWLVGGSALDPNLGETHPGALLMPAYLDCRRTMIDLFRDICASVQFHIDTSGDNITSIHHLSVPTPPSAASSRSTTPFAAFNRAKALGGYLLVRPLMVVRSVIMAPTAERRWVGKLMDHIALHYGIHVAHLLANTDENPGWPLMQPGSLYMDEQRRGVRGVGG